jgi:hypothetical protein
LQAQSALDWCTTTTGHQKAALTLAVAAAATAAVLGLCAVHKCLSIFVLPYAWCMLRRRIFPPVAGGVIEDIKFLGNSTVLVAYYGELGSLA